LADVTATLEANLRLSLASMATFSSGPRRQDLTLHLARGEDVTAAADALCAAGLSLATLVATDETGTDEHDVKLRYIFEPATTAVDKLDDIFVTLLVPLEASKPELPSICARVPSANWHEREAQDMFGVIFADHPDPRPLVLHDGWPQGLFPLRKDFDARERRAVEAAEEFPHLTVEGEGVLEVPVGPIHAGIIEPGHFRFSTVGESVLHLEPRLFYTHRGLEKRIEGLTIEDGLLVAERMCGVCAVAHGLGFCEAAEQIAGIEVPGRARALRTLALELERLYNHTGDLGNICAGASYHYGTSAGLRVKEALQQLGERLTGNRFLRGLVTPGGVSLDLTPDLARSIESTLLSTTAALDDLLERIENNPTVIDRLDTTGILRREDALALGVTGVAARASGVDRDARRDHPHAAYGSSSDLVVAVSTLSDGDVHARLSLRALEVRESTRLVRVLASSLPAGPLRAAMPFTLPAWGTGLCSIESPRGASVHWLRTDDAGRIDRYHLRSASYANWPAVPLAAHNAIIPDFPLVNKSFELCYACTDR
jgi:Ni,Fe-hydrogenase III large subunit/Ni,Fe-hydrogenase III component G